MPLLRNCCIVHSDGIAYTRRYGGNMKRISAVICLCFCLFCTFFLSAQETEDFGFTDGDEGNDSFTVNIGGRFALGGVFFVNDFKTFKDTHVSSIIDGKLHIHARAPVSEAYFGVRLTGKTVGVRIGSPEAVFPVYPQIPRWIDEAFVKILLGPAVLSGGIQKLNWGRAEQFSVLDIINPRDKTDMTVSDPQELKIGRPLLSAAVYFPYDIKCEGVFLPVFEGNHIPAEKNARWYSRRFDSVLQLDRSFFTKPVSGDTLEYAQGGARLTVSVDGRHDLGVQYFYGRLPDPAFKVIPQSGTVGQPRAVYGMYNPYHHIGVDYGTGAGPIAFTAEFAANITADLTGSIPSIYNPALAWNTGIRYSGPYSLSLALNALETVRLHHNRIHDPYDVEKDCRRTDTRLVFSVSQLLLRNSFEWKLNAVIGLEDADFCIMPEIQWQFATLMLNAAAGMFGGRKTGARGQFRKNSFIRLSAAYAF